MAANKMDMNVKKGIVYAQNFIDGEFEDAAAGYVDSHNPVVMEELKYTDYLLLSSYCHPMVSQFTDWCGGSLRTECWHLDKVTVESGASESS